MSEAADRLTVLVPTRDRYPRLMRLLRYLAGARPSLNIVVLDSSTTETDRAGLDAVLDAGGATYRRYEPDLPLMAKVVEGLESVDTPYVVCLADDDFMVPRTLVACAEHLDADPSCAVVHGRSALATTRPKDGGLEITSLGEYPQRAVSGRTAVERLLDHLEHYRTTFYSVRRIENVRESARQCLEAGFGHNWGEYYLSGMSVLPGRVDMLEGLYMVREAHEAQDSVSAGHDFFDLMTAEGAGRSYAVLRDLLASEVARIDGVDRASAEAAVKQAWWAFVTGTLSAKYETRYLGGRSAAARVRNAVRVVPGARTLAKTLRRSAPGAAFPWSLERPSSPYHEDFMAIRRAIESPP